MSTEQRDIRPIGVVDALQDLLSAAVLHVGAQTFEIDDRVMLEEIDYMHAQIAVSLGGPAKVAAALAAAAPELAALDLELRHLEFTVILTSGYLRILEFRHRMPLADLATADELLVLTTGERPAALRTWRSGCTIELSVHLSEQRPKKILKPWRVGSWVARSAWGLTTDAGFTGFTPKPLTAEKKTEFGLAPKAVRYITLGASPLEQDVTEESVELWLDADLLAKISANPKSKVAVSMQRQLFVDAVAVVVNETRVAEEFDLLVWSDVEKTLLGRVISLVTPNASTEEARRKAGTEYLDMLKADPARFMTFVEQAALLGGAYDAGLDG